MLGRQMYSLYLMKWLVVAGILVYVVVKVRSTLVKHPVLGPAFRVLLGPEAPGRTMTPREWLRGALYLSGFAAAGIACHLGLVRASQWTSWSFLDSPYLESLAATTLWVGGLAGCGAVFSLIAAVVQGVRPKAVRARQEDD